MRHEVARHSLGLQLEQVFARWVELCPLRYLGGQLRALANIRVFRNAPPSDRSENFRSEMGKNEKFKKLIFKSIYNILLSGGRQRARPSQR